MTKGQLECQIRKRRAAAAKGGGFRTFAEMLGGHSLEWVRQQERAQESDRIVMLRAGCGVHQPTRL